MAIMIIASRDAFDIGYTLICPRADHEGADEISGGTYRFATASLRLDLIDAGTRALKRDHMRRTDSGL